MNNGRTFVSPGTGPFGKAGAAAHHRPHATGRYSDDTLALEAARRGYRSSRTGRPLTAVGMADLLRNPIYNGYLVRFRGFADEERAEAPWRSGLDGAWGRKPRFDHAASP